MFLVWVRALREWSQSAPFCYKPLFKMKSLRHCFPPQSTNTYSGQEMYTQWMTMSKTIWMGKPFSPFCKELNCWKEAKEVTHLTSCFWLNNLKSLKLFIKFFWVLGTMSSIIDFPTTFNFFIFLEGDEIQCLCIDCKSILCFIEKISFASSTWAVVWLLLCTGLGLFLISSCEIFLQLSQGRD